MATLLEIAARELRIWPANADVLMQSDDGTIRFDGFTYDFHDASAFKAAELATDRDNNLISRADWERARTAYLDSIAAGQSTASDCKPQEPKTQAASGKAAISYEQRLWDEVAIVAVGGLTASRAFHDYQSYQGQPINAALFGADVADAFMAERAKRIGGKA